MDVIKQIENISNMLDEVDNYTSLLPHLLSEEDMAIGDLYHYLESNKMNSKSSYRFAKELKNRLIKRRNIKNDMHVLRTYENNKQKLLLENNRKMLIGEIYKAKKQLSTQYNNRVYTSEELKSLLED